MDGDFLQGGYKPFRPCTNLVTLKRICHVSWDFSTIAIKVVFGRELLQKNEAEYLFRHILQDTFFCKMAKCTTL